jgi:hypothetical protein
MIGPTCAILLITLAMLDVMNGLVLQQERQVLRDFSFPTSAFHALCMTLQTILVSL